MENPGVMSLWLGNFKSKEMLQKYVEIKFDEKGDRIPSQFMRDFQINFIDYNEDLLEITFIGNLARKLHFQNVQGIAQFKVEMNCHRMCKNIF
ncbi:MULTISPECIES: immunity 22 family protein [Bacillus]|uniref:immunity 22 family protein n=2 Tax=Bacillus TaxID=1386 RepID=UPI0020D261D0|nr:MULTISPECIES: immunity 22 family protein [Bacillus]